MKNKLFHFPPLLIGFLLLVPVLLANAASPEGRYGWWTFASDIIGDDSSCGVGYVKYELSIREIGTNNPVSVSSALFVAGNKIGGAITSQVSGAGPTVGTICFNPDTQFLAVDIDATAGHYDFYASGAIANPELIPRGKFMRATVWITPTSINTPEYEQVSPVNTTINTDPTYNLNLGVFPSTYGASGIQYVSLLIYNWNTGALVQRTSVPLSGGSGIKTMPAQNLSDGIYTWRFYISLNGSYDPGGFMVQDILKSGRGMYSLPFVLDRAVPVINASTGHAPSNPTSSDVVTVTGSASDSLAGMSSIKVYIDSALRNTCTYGGVSTADCSATGGPYAASSSHTYYIVATDSAGNTATSSLMNFTVAPEAPSLVFEGANTVINYTGRGNYLMSGVRGTDQSGKTIRFGVDDDNNSTVDRWLPSNGYVPSGSLELIFAPPVMPSNPGNYTYKVLVENSDGLRSAFISHTFALVNSGLTATPGACGSNSISINWNNTPDGIVDGNRYSNTDHGHIIVKNSTTTAYQGFNNSFVDLSVIPGATYEYYLISVFDLLYANGTTDAHTPVSLPITVTAPSACVSPDLTAGNTFPAANTYFYVPDFDPGSVLFRGTAQNNNVTNITQGGWADIEVDLYSDGTYTNYNAYGGSQLGAFSLNETKNLSYFYNAVPEGTHRYRFHVDTDGTGVSESDESNNRSPWVTFIITKAPPDLISQNLTVSAGPYTQGTSIAVNAEVKNISVNTTFPWGFTDEFYYQWNGTGGAWTSFIGIGREPLGVGQTSADVYNFTPTQGGTLYFRHCVDSLNAINEGVNETPNCSETSVTVDPGIPPNISAFSVCLQAEPTTCTNAFGTVMVPASTSLTIAWAATADTCSVISGPGFIIPGNVTTGSSNFNAVSTPSESHRYQIGCQYGSSAPVVSWIDVITAQQLPTLTSAQTVVIEGNSTTLSWDTNNGDASLCTLNGGGLSGNAVLTAGSETGSTNVSINGRTTFVLTCGALSAVKTIEIIPTGWEA